MPMSFIELNKKNNNPAITEVTAKLTGEDSSMVLLAWNCCADFIAQTIKAGEFDTVRLPYLGKFTPNYKRIHKIDLIGMMPKPEVLYESVSNKRELRTGAEQGMDTPDTGICGSAEEGQGE